MTAVKVAKLQKVKAEVGEGIVVRHTEAAAEFETIKKKITESDEKIDTKGKNDKMSDDLDKLLEF